MACVISVMIMKIKCAMLVKVNITLKLLISSRDKELNGNKRWVSPSMSGLRLRRISFKSFIDILRKSQVEKKTHVDNESSCPIAGAQ